MNFHNLITILMTKPTNACIHSFISIVIQLIIIHSFEGVSSQPKTIETIKFNSELFRVIVNRENNDIIVGARNGIYRLSANPFTKVDEFRTGPLYDSTDCFPAPMVCESTKNLTNNDNQILLINYDNQKFPVLLVCGNAYQGQCYITRADNLSNNTFYGRPNDTMSYVGSRSSSFAFFAPSSTPKSVLYVAHAYDGRPIQLSPPTISSRKLRGFEGFALRYDSISYNTAVDIDSKYKQFFDVKYMYGFNYSNYSYFVSTQPITVGDTNQYETKLIRICNNDKKFFSYSEIPLICSSSSGFQRTVWSDSSSDSKHIYSIGITAYFNRISSQQFGDLNITSESDSYTLFVSFGVPTVGTAINTTIGSAICAFSINQINKAFTNAAKECFRGGTGVGILEHIYGKRRECKRLHSEVTDQFCGIGYNPYIGSTQTLGGFLLNSIRGEVTSLAVAVQNDRTMAMVGTSDGDIMKVTLDYSSHWDQPLFTTSSTTRLTNRSIQPNPAFDNNEKYLYVLSGDQLVRFPFGSCSPYTHCSRCLAQVDPLECGWCGSFCATDDECNNTTLMSRTQCPPQVFDFWPKYGPLLGGTLITIIGDNFRNGINITVADNDCEITERSDQEVKCRTKAVRNTLSGSIGLTVSYHGLLDGYMINGTAVSKRQFKYLEPQLLGVYPSFGPRNGGTNVTIIGHNLRIGYNRTIYLAGIQCKEIESNSTNLNCTTGPQLSVSSPPDISVRLIIDSTELTLSQNKTIEDQKHSNEWSERFEYKPNPKIVSFEPKTTIFGGNTNLTVSGEHLNSVHNPRIRINSSSAQIQIDSSCRVNSLGTEMVCPTPSIQSSTHSSQSLPIDTELSFVLDGVRDYGLKAHTYRLIYYPDPIYYSFEEKTRLVYLEEPILRIDGKQLYIDYPIDIRIGSIHQIPCIISEVNSFDAIYCRIEYNELLFRSDNKEYIVYIRVGNIKFSPGNIRFCQKSGKSIGVATILVSTLALILLLVVVVIGVMFYLKTRGLLINKQHAHFIEYIPETKDNGENLIYIPKNLQNNYDDCNCNDVAQPILPVPAVASGSRAYPISEDTINLLRVEHLLIEQDNIALEEVIGQGQFGCVYKGILKFEKEVAVKSLNRSTILDETEIESFLQEGLIMKDFSHQHVLTLIGVCIRDNGSPLVVLPFMLNGDLLSYIRDNNNKPTVKRLLGFAIQVAKGMEYLSGQKYVHRDLAARNCMLDEELCVKVADFGLSRDIYSRDYYSSDNQKTKLPVKWMSIESLEKGIYTSASDVWSYGVLVWELLTRGVTPYPDVDNWDILNYLKQSRRLLRPAFCPELLYSILLRCWSQDSKLRSTFAELVFEVQEIIARLEKCVAKQRLDLDKCNNYINYPILNTYSNESKLSQSLQT